MTNILIKKEIFSANYKYSDQKGKILTGGEKGGNKFEQLMQFEVAQGEARPRRREQCWSWSRKPKNGEFYEILKFNPNKIKYVYYYNQGHLHRKPNFTELVNESKDVLAEEEERTSLNISFSKSNIPHAYLIFVTNV